MINLHIYWMQGWDNAPPRALRNRDAWISAGFNVICWDDENVGLKFKRLMPPAMRADITLARAMCNLGGVAVGADSSPLDVDSWKKSIEILPYWCGQVIWQSKKSSIGSPAQRPYIAGSYFNKGNPFIKDVVATHNILLKRVYKRTPNPFNLTGPKLWAKMYAKHSRYVNVIAGGYAFLKEPRITARSNSAWLDAGFANDWNGTKKQVWK